MDLLYSTVPLFPFAQDKGIEPKKAKTEENGEEDDVEDEEDVEGEEDDEEELVEGEGRALFYFQWKESIR